MPTVTYTPTISQTCQTNLFSDSFSNSSDLSSWQYCPISPGGEGYTISGGSFNFSQAVTDTSNYGGGGYYLLNNSVVSSSLSSYTVETDFKLNNYSNNGVFGVVFRGSYSATAHDYYTFCWNGNPSPGCNCWQVVQYYGTTNSTYNYVASGTTAPTYTPGTWVHMKAVCIGPTFSCYVNFNDGNGDHLVYTATDSNYTSGSCGIDADFLYSPANLNVENFKLTGCP
jgi:hypothetical protein